MYTEIHYPINKIPGATLDEYLSKGWFRMGQTIFTCWFLFMEKGFYSAIWIRQDLEGFTFKKRSRKLLNRNSLTLDASDLDKTLDAEPIGVVRSQSFLNKAKDSVITVNQETKVAIQGWIKKSKKSLKEKSLNFKELKMNVLQNSSFSGGKLGTPQPVPSGDRPKMMRRLSSRSLQRIPSFSKRMVDL